MENHGLPSLRVTTILALMTIFYSFPADGQTTEVGVSVIRQRVAAAAPTRYDAGRLHRLFLGNLHRDLWALEMDLPVLDLNAFAGGLTPSRRGGGLQTRSLRFQGADGQQYTFRSLQKDATRNLDPLLQRSLTASILQDQIAALFPLSAIVVAPLLDAAGVLHVDPVLVVLPSDGSLGEFTEEYGGLPGWIEVRPNEGPDGEIGFAGAIRVTGSKAFLNHLEDGPEERTDAKAYLRARLMDLFVGDWDRHPDQWRWAAFREGDRTRWMPIPRDRDWALSKIDGILPGLARSSWPNYVGFSKDYASVFGTTWNGRALDRQLLSGLSRAEWRSVATDLAELLTDPILDAAVDPLPVSYQERVGTDLRRALKARRDGLVDAAMKFYGILTGWVDVIATDVDELAVVDRTRDGAVRLRIFADRDASLDTASPYFDRTLVPSETKEIRIFLRGGDDRAIVRGGSGPIRVRVIGGGGDDTFSDLTNGGKVYFYDQRGTNNVGPDSQTGLDSTAFVEPDDTESATHQARPRDWGSRWSRLPILGINTDIGPFFGQTFTRESYGWRRFPWSSRLSIDVKVLPFDLGLEGGATLESRLGVGPTLGVFSLKGSSRSIRRYHGLGNGTIKAGAANFFRADLGFVEAYAGLSIRPSEKISLDLGSNVSFSTPVHEGNSFVEAERPYGFGDFLRTGLVTRFIVDTRDVSAAPRRGSLLDISGEFTPSLGDAEEAYGSLSGALSHNVSFGRPTLSVGISGQKVWGDFPYFDGAFLGGPTSLRGFDRERFLGDASILFSGQIRSPVSDFFFLLPGTLGVHGVLDSGRVFHRKSTTPDADSGAYHTAWGGGIWTSFVKSAYTFSLTAVHGEEGTGIYFSLGFGY